MNHNFPVYTVARSCQDCYKCVRHCPCKAIKVENGSASIIPELCVSCGRCVRVCPVHAKKIRPDLSRGRFLLEDSNNMVIASIAPSYVSYFKNVNAKTMITALKKLGFYGVSETAHGAQIVSSECASYMAEKGNGVYISSACPSAVEFINKYLSEYTRCIVPMKSPLLAHANLLKKEFGENVKVIFFGPCAAKKNEADSHHGELDLSLTFADLDDWFKQENINLASLIPDEGAEFLLGNAEEGKIYPFEGGMNDTIRKDGDDVQYLAMSGLENIRRILGSDVSAASNKDKKIFIECLACAGGCINGPVMPEESDSLANIIRTSVDYRNENSCDRNYDLDIREGYFEREVKDNDFSEADIKNILLSIGKKHHDDELNCGGCGYYTCRSFARALLEGKAESSMCVSYLKQSAQKKSNALIRYIPAGVVIVDSNMKIIECNENFADLFDESTRLAYEVTPGLSGVELNNIIEFTELFEAALSSGKDIVRNNYVCGDKILNISIFTIEVHRIVGAILQDVTKSELRREQISEKAREVIQKNVITVQKIAHYLGEHMAETEVLLREVASGYSNDGNKE